MIKIPILVLLLCGLLRADYSNPFYYSYYPSLNYFPTSTLYNFNVYEAAQYTWNVSYNSSPLAPDNQPHSGFQDYYQIDFANGPFKLNYITLTADPALDEYVKTYRLTGTVDNISWFDINGGILYPGLRNSTDTATFYFTLAYNVLGIRFIPVEYFSRPTFNLVIGYDDVIDTRNRTAERNVVILNAYQNPANQTYVAPSSETLPQNYVLYKQDKFNAIDYYASTQGVEGRDKNVVSATVYNDTAGTSPYALLGNENFLKTVLNFFFDNLLVPDPVVGPFFRGLNAAQHKELVLQFFTKMLGGTLDYKGKDMVTAHTGMALLASQFDRFVGLIVKAFALFNVHQDLQQEIARRLEFYRIEIVGK